MFYVLLIIPESSALHEYEAITIPESSWVIFLQLLVYSSLFLTLQVLEGERHDAPRSSSSHQALDVGGGQGEHQALLPAQVPACVERNEDGLVQAWRRPGHHATYRVSQLLRHQERLKRAHIKTHTHTRITS